MENFIVSARKYRPSTFDSVIGQRALTTTLKNAIATGKLAQAYLFCGPRGVGKTTCARIFAKTINCTNITPDGEACNECESCKAFNEQRSYNIHELDAASNNSVEDIRSLIEQVRIPPQIGRYKVYIIDEVHMLSSSAFNAFLKTLEEPPAHAIFILATTEKHKILPTILSRCQIYDFNRIGVNDIIEHLQYVAQKEGIEAEPEALNVIAQKADGGMRDALSIFDQVVSFTGGKIHYQDVIANLNVLDYEYYFKLTDDFLGNRVSDCLLTFNDILNKGFDGSHFITGLASHFRDLLVSKDKATASLLETAASVKVRYAEQAGKCSAKFLFRAMKLCNDCDLNYRVSKNKRLLVELTLIQLAQITLEEEEGPAGRSPKNKISPIFQKEQSQAQPAVQPASQPTIQTAQAQPQQPVPSVQTVPGTPGANAQTPVQEPERVSPMVKKPVHLSIKALKGDLNKIEAEEQPQDQLPLSATEAKIENRPFSEQDINLRWTEFALLLPKKDTAMAGNMKNMNPKMLDATTFEIVVDNSMAEKDMLDIKPQIENHLRTKLHNDLITMQVRISEQGEMIKAYSKTDQWQLIQQKNASLQKLKDLLDLELS